MKKKVWKTVLYIIVAVLLWNHLPYKYNNEKAVNHVTKNANKNSGSKCAWYVMRAMQSGGCPVGIVPAYAYNKILPQMGFEEISTEKYKPQRGDISVLPTNNRSAFGHIAIFNGHKWVSDFEQGEIYPGQAYRDNGKYQLFRINDGWHWKNVWTWPTDWCQWIMSLAKGYDKIKF